MFHSILVPLDGSKFAEQALPLALSIANRAGASVEVVLVHVLYALQQPECSWLPFDPTEDAIFKAHEQAYLDAVVKRLQKNASVPVAGALACGVIVDGILERARSKAADLIVMTTHGRGSLSRFWLGSVALEVVLEATAPVLLVHPHEDSGSLGAGDNLQTHPDSFGRHEVGRRSAGTGHRTGKSHGRGVHVRSSRPAGFASRWLSRCGGTQRDQAASA